MGSGSRTGIEAGTRSGKWSVIMDCLLFLLVSIRRLRFCLAVNSLRKREAPEKGLMKSLPVIERVWVARDGSSAPEVGTPRVVPRGGGCGSKLGAEWACGSEVNFVCRFSLVGGGEREERGSDSASETCMLGVATGD